MQFGKPSGHNTANDSLGVDQSEMLELEKRPASNPLRLTASFTKEQLASMSFEFTKQDM